MSTVPMASLPAAPSPVPAPTQASGGWEGNLQAAPGDSLAFFVSRSRLQGSILGYQFLYGILLGFQTPAGVVRFRRKGCVPMSSSLLDRALESLLISRARGNRTSSGSDAC